MRANVLGRALLLLPAAVFLLTAPCPSAAGDAVPALDRARNGIRLLAFAPDAGARFDVSVPSAAAALDRIAAALDRIERKSPASAAAIEALKKEGAVSLV